MYLQKLNFYDRTRCNKVERESLREINDIKERSENEILQKIT